MTRIDANLPRGIPGFHPQRVRTNLFGTDARDVSRGLPSVRSQKAWLDPARGVRAPHRFDPRASACIRVHPRSNSSRSSGATRRQKQIPGCAEN